MAIITYKTAEEKITSSVIISEETKEKFTTDTNDEFESLSIEISSTSTGDNS